MESHLADCSECSKTLRGFEKISSLMAASATRQVPGSVLARLRDLPQTRERSDLLPVAQWLTAIASALLVASLSLSALNGGSEAPSAPANPAWMEVATTSREADAEILEEPEVVLTQWVVAGLFEGNTR